MNRRDKHALRDLLAIVTILAMGMAILMSLEPVRDAACFAYFMVIFGAAIAWHFGWPIIVGFLGLDVVVMATFAAMLARRSQLERRQL